MRRATVGLHQRLFSLFIFASSWLALPLASAQDVITLKGDNSQPNTEVRGDVVDWNSLRLIYQSNGRNREIPARRVQSVDYVKTQEHQQADDLLQQQRFVPAIGSYDVALGKENRQWVQREILGGKLRAARAENRLDWALGTYLQLLELEPQNRFRHLIPLAWSNETPAANTASELATWLNASDESRSLVAASWLLPVQPTETIDRLKQLRRSNDPMIAHLATAQLWRSEVLTVDQQQLDRWVQQLERMPLEIRAGPIFVLGHARQRLGQSDEAALAWMQLPILYSDEYQLCGEALRQTAAQLEEAGYPDEAEVVKRELVTRFAHTRAAATLDQRVESFSNDGERN